MGLLTDRLLNSNSVKVRSLISATWRTDEDLTDTVMDWFWRFRVSSSPFQSRTAVAENASSFDVLPRVVKFEIRKRRTGWKHACTYYSIQSVIQLFWTSEATNESVREWDNPRMSPSFSQWKKSNNNRSTAPGPRDGEDAGNVKHVAWT